MSSRKGRKGRTSHRTSNRDDLQKLCVLLFDGAADGIMILDSDYRVRHANPAMCQMLETTQDRLLNTEVRGLLPSVLWYNDIEEIRQQIQRSGRSIFETIALTGTGVRITVEVSVSIASHRENDIVICICRELRQRQTHAAITENISLYQTLFEQSNDAIFLLGLDGRHLLVNQRCSEMLGYSREELLQLGIPDLVVPEELDHAYMRLAQLVRGESIPPYRRHLRRKDNTIIEVELNVTLVRDREGSPICIQSVARDITQSETTRRSVAEKEQMLLTLYEFLHQGVAYRDSKNRTILVNPAFEQIVGRTLAQLKEEEPDPFPWERRNANGGPLPDEERPSSVALRTRQPVRDFLMSIYNPKMGCWRWISVDAVPLIMRGESRPYGVFLILDDITERREMMQALTDSERRYRLLAENAHDIVYRYQYLPTPRFEYVSPASTTIVGYTPEEHYADPQLGLKIVHPDDRHIITDLPRQIKPSGMKFASRWIHKNGHVIWIEQNLVPIYDDRGRLVAVEGIARDITAQKNAEAELRRSYNMLDLFASLLRHDLRNDLQIVMIQAGLALSIEYGADAYRAALTSIITTAQRMANLLNMVWSPSDEMNADLRMIIERSARDAEKSYPGLQVTITDEFASTVCLSNVSLLSVVFDNLLRNAATYAGSNARVHMTMRSEPAHVLIDVCDDGPGIPPDIRPMLFQKGVSTTGSGYGLYLTRKIVEIYGGTVILLDSERGACFRIRLPVTAR